MKISIVVLVGNGIPIFNMVTMQLRIQLLFSLVTILFTIHCRDAANIVTSDYSRTEGSIQIYTEEWKQISFKENLQPIPLGGFFEEYWDYYPDWKSSNPSQLVLRADGFWMYPLGWILLIPGFALMSWGIYSISRQDPNHKSSIKSFLATTTRVILLSTLFIVLVGSILESQNRIQRIEIDEESQSITWKRVYYFDSTYPVSYLSYVKEGNEEIQLVTIAGEYLKILRTNDSSFRRKYSKLLASTLGIPRVYSDPTEKEWASWVKISKSRGAQWTIPVGKEIPLERQSLTSPYEWAVSIPGWEYKKNPRNLVRWLFHVFLFLLMLIILSPIAILGFLLGGFYGLIVLGFRNLSNRRKYPNDWIQEVSLVSFKSKPFWTLYFLWVLVAGKLSYTIFQREMELPIQQSTIVSMDSNNTQQEFFSRKSETPSENTQILDDSLPRDSSESEKEVAGEAETYRMSWKEYFYFVFIGDPWEQWKIYKAILNSLDRSEQEAKIATEKIAEIQCNHTRLFIVDVSLSCTIRSSELYETYQISQKKEDPFHWEIITRILDSANPKKTD